MAPKSSPRHNIPRSQREQSERAPSEFRAHAKKSPGLKKKRSPRSAARDPRESAGKRGTAERVARRERRRGERKKRSATTTPGARLGQHAEKLGKRVAEVAWFMVHAARAKQAAPCTIPFPKGDRGDCLHTTVCKLPKHAQLVRAFNGVGREFCAWREGQGMRLPSAGRQPTRQTVRARHKSAARVLARPAAAALQLKRLFLSPSAFFEPAKKVRKNSKSWRPTAVSRDTAQQKPCARATRAASPSKANWPTTRKIGDSPIPFASVRKPIKSPLFPSRLLLGSVPRLFLIRRERKGSCHVDDA